jgi:hypothetical protein
MKNIHVLPTDKLSNGYILGKCIKELSDVKIGQFTKTYYLMFSEEYFQPHNIYITSDEEIKEGDWYFNNTGSAIEKLNNRLPSGGYFCKKIILTTDQDLIENGVQAIGDGFLEWFVKNPTCEEVEVEHTYISFELNKPTSKYYKIILPKKNFYCGDKFDYDEQCLEQCENCVDAKGVDYGYLSKEQQKKHIINMMEKDQELGLYDIENDWDKILEEYYDQPKLNFISLNKWLKENYEIPKKKMGTKEEIKLEDIFNDEKRQGVKELIDKHKQDDENYLDSFGVTKTQFEVYRNFNKQETLEETVNAFKKTDVYINEIKQKQERMYSEEEVKRLAFDFYYDMSHKMGVATNLISENATNVDVWFKQFKNK